MCVICYIPKEVELPRKERIRAMWDSNPDGAGLFWIENGKVHISKGYFNFETFYKDILIVKDYNYELAIHMRIATAGGISQRMCHPFPISNKASDMFNLDGVYDSAIMHNGVIHINNRKEYSDTAEFVVTNLYSRYLTDRRFYNHLSEKATRKLEESISGSRMIFFGGDGSIKMIGNWTEKNGCYYSNLNFEWRERKYNYSESYKSYGYSGYYYNDYDSYDSYLEYREKQKMEKAMEKAKEKAKEKANRNKMQNYMQFCVDTYGCNPFEE